MTDHIQPPIEESQPTEIAAEPPETAALSKPALQSARIVKIKFRPAGRHYDFNALSLTLALGDRVVVETDRGRALGTVVAVPREVTGSAIPDGLKSIMRHAVTEDLNMAATFATREATALRFCRDRVAERKMEMKLVRAEYLFDGSKIIFYFTADGRIDFRELVKDLAHYFHTRIEMRQIGVRDEAKLTGGIGICGRELCCCTYLNEFVPVSVKMAKEQGLALNPNKISGQCGRLLCCLAYEFETYCDLKKSLPKCGRKVTIEGREGEVIDQQLLRQTVTVSFGQEKVVMTAEEVEKGVLPQRLGSATSAPDKSAAPPNGRPDRNHRESQPGSTRNRPQSPPQPSRQTPPSGPSGRPLTQQPAQPPQKPQTQPAAKEQPQPVRPQQTGRRPQQPARLQPQAQQEPKTAPQEIKGSQASEAETPAAESRRKRHRNRRRGRKPGAPTTPEAGE